MACLTSSSEDFLYLSCLTLDQSNSKQSLCNYSLSSLRYSLKIPKSIVQGVLILCILVHMTSLICLGTQFLISISYVGPMTKYSLLGDLFGDSSLSKIGRDIRVD